MGGPAPRAQHAKSKPGGSAMSGQWVGPPRVRSTPKVTWRVRHERSEWWCWQSNRTRLLQVLPEIQGKTSKGAKIEAQNRHPRSKFGLLCPFAPRSETGKLTADIRECRADIREVIVQPAPGRTAKSCMRPNVRSHPESGHSSPRHRTSALRQKRSFRMRSLATPSPHHFLGMHPLAQFGLSGAAAAASSSFLRGNKVCANMPAKTQQLCRAVLR